MTIGELIRKYREENGLSQREFSVKSGVSNVTISMYEKNGINPKTGKPFSIGYETYAKIADAIGMNIDEMFELLGDDAMIDTIPKNLISISRESLKRIPLIGSVAAGQPILATESYDVYIDSPAKADYALRVEGDSMEPTYLDGDVVYIRQVDDVDDGTVAVVLVEDEACLKRVYHIKNGLQLVSENPKYPPMIRQIPAYSSIRILGIVVGYTRMYKA